MGEDHGAILRAHVGSLAITSRGIVVLPECVEQVVVADHRRIEGYFDDFSVPGVIAAHILIRGLRHAAPRVSHLGGLHSRQLAERSFHTPKTARTERCLLHISIVTGELWRTLERGPAPCAASLDCTSPQT